MRGSSPRIAGSSATSTSTLSSLVPPRRRSTLPSATGRLPAGVTRLADEAASSPICSASPGSRIVDDVPVSSSSSYTPEPPKATGTTTAQPHASRNGIDSSAAATPGPSTRLVAASTRNASSMGPSWLQAPRES